MDQTSTEALGTDLTLHRVVVGPMGNNAYLIAHDSGEAVLVDAADEAPVLRELVQGHRVTTLLTTHQHHDHIGALPELAEATGARLVAGTPDVEGIERQCGVRCEGLWGGDQIVLGGHELGLVGLVGHTPGSLTLVVRPDEGPVHLFTGDSLFPGGVGRTTSPEDFTSLLDGVEAELFAPFDDDTVVHPGHGEPTTLGAERPRLAEWRQRGW